MLRYVAGVDTSTQSCKVVIVNPETGEVIRSGKANHPDGTSVDPEAWWKAFLEAVDQAGGLDDVEALSVGGQQHGMVLLDAEGNIIRDAILWNDTRSARAADELTKELGATWWAENTGSVPVASLTVTKLRWLADAEPENVKKIAAICLPHDWLTWKIMGAPALSSLTTDRSDASGTGYVAADGSTYLVDVLARALRLPEKEAGDIILPRILGPYEVAGFGDANRGWGEIALGPGVGDNAGAALGVDLKAGEALLSLGTSGVVSVVSDHPVADKTGLVNGFSDGTGNWLPLACTLNASRIIDAMARIINADYDEFDRLALSVPDAGGLVLEPYFEGERTPNLPEATATLSGMTLANSDRAHVARGSIEGFLKLMRGALDAVRALGVDIGKVYLVGGGAKSMAVQTLAPEILDAQVEIAAPGEYVALGAARQASRLNR